MLDKFQMAISSGASAHEGLFNILQACFPKFWNPLKKQNKHIFRPPPPNFLCVPPSEGAYQRIY